MRPTIEQAYQSRDFKTAKAQKACTKQRREIATRVTKSGAGVDANQGTSRAGASTGRQEGGS